MSLCNTCLMKHSCETESFYGTGGVIENCDLYKGNTETTFQTKDSGLRQKYESGMQRDTQDGKPRFDLITPEGQPYNETMKYRWAMLMMRGAKKYGDRNWEKANSEEELKRFKQSAVRHFEQWLCGETDEDHASAVFFNITAYEWLKEKL